MTAVTGRARVGHRGVRLGRRGRCQGQTARRRAGRVIRDRAGWLAVPGRAWPPTPGDAERRVQAGMVLSTRRSPSTTARLAATAGFRCRGGHSQRFVVASSRALQRRPGRRGTTWCRCGLRPGGQGLAARLCCNVARSRGSPTSHPCGRLGCAGARGPHASLPERSSMPASSRLDDASLSIVDAITVVPDHRGDSQLAGGSCHRLRRGRAGRCRGKELAWRKMENCG